MGGPVSRWLIFPFLLCAAAAARADAVPPLTGFFGGGFGGPGAFTYTQIELEEAGQSLKGKIYQPYERTDAPPIERVERRGDEIEFEADGLGFELRRTAAGYEGHVRTPAGVLLPAWFAIRPGSPPPALLARFEGSYDLGGGRLLSVSRNNDGGGFWYVELPSGRTGFLFNLSDSEFIAGPCLYCAGPERLRLRFEPKPDGARVETVKVRLDGAERVAPRAAGYREEAISFTSSDGTSLAGTLFLPEGRRRHPAVVLVHGSGGQTRNGFFGHIRFLAEAYARRGIAALAYDKRGTGDSAGNWEQAGLAALADDAAAALRYLAGRSDIRPNRLAVSGSSQAGWIVPMAASRFPTVRIVQIRSGSAPMGVEESERRRLARQMQADGFAPAEIERAMRIRIMMDDFARTGSGWQALAAAVEPVKDAYWMKRYIGDLPAPESPDWAWLREAFGYEVGPDFTGYGGRAQILYGDADALIDPAVPAALVRRAFAAGRPREVDIEVLPRATHNGFEGTTGGEREFPGLSRFIPGYFDIIVEWAARRLR